MINSELNIRRCLPGYSKVYSNRGVIHMKDIQVNDEVLTMGGYEKVLSTFEQGVQKLIQIIATGKLFSCTPNHRIAYITKMSLVENHMLEITYDFKEASKLNPGDCLIKLVSSASDISHFYSLINTTYRIRRENLCLFTSEVIGIIDGETVETYDIEVTNRQEFFCEGVLTHNSSTN